MPMTSICTGQFRCILIMVVYFWNTITHNHPCIRTSLPSYVSQQSWWGYISFLYKVLWCFLLFIRKDLCGCNIWQWLQYVLPLSQNTSRPSIQKSIRKEDVLASIALTAEVQHWASTTSCHPLWIKNEEKQAVCEGAPSWSAGPKQHAAADLRQGQDSIGVLESFSIYVGLCVSFLDVF
jgi:hypothetical protein